MSRDYKCVMSAVTTYSGNPGNGMTVASTNNRAFGITSGSARYGVRMEFAELADIPSCVTVTGMVLRVKLFYEYRRNGDETIKYCIYSGYKLQYLFTLTFTMISTRLLFRDTTREQKQTGRVHC